MTINNHLNQNPGDSTEKLDSRPRITFFTSKCAICVGGQIINQMMHFIQFLLQICLVYLICTVQNKVEAYFFSYSKNVCT